MRFLFASVGLAPLAVSLAAGASHAATLTISAKQTTPVKSSTAVGGAPGDISITSAGSIVPTGGAAVTLDSANSVANAGTISITDATSSATGILATTTGAKGSSISNTGAITINETASPKNTDSSNAFANGSDRYGIRVAGAFQGSIVNSGAIAIKGNNSAGIALDGPLTGSLTQNGTISVVGNNSVGVSAGAISGDALIAGSILAQGQGSRAVSLTGDIAGALTVQGTITATGYRYTTPPSDLSTLGKTDLLQGGPALSIAGSVTGGVIFAVPAADSTDTSAGSAAVTSYGAAPAVQIGSTTEAITIGAIKGSNYSIVVDGAVSGNGVYDGVAGTGMLIGGLGQTVAVTKGLSVNGTITATANNGSATALHIGSGATVPAIANAGTIGAAGGGGSSASNSAILIDVGANVSSIANSGLIAAQSADVAAKSTAIYDKSGTVTSVANTGTIGATGAAAGNNVAIDLSASTKDATVTQSAAASGASAPAIVGDIHFGTGNDTLDLETGSMTGNVAFGGGADTFKLSNDAVFTGSITDGAGVALNITGGTFNATGTGVTVKTLSVGAGTLGVNIDSATGAATLYQVTGAASFSTGAQLAVHISDVTRSIGDYTVIKAGSLSGTDNLTLGGVMLPYIYKGSIETNAAAGTVQVAIDRKTTGELGLNGAESRAYDAVYAALGTDKGVGDSFLAINDRDTLRRSVRTFLPDHAGGAFETVTAASRATARMFADPDAPVVQAGGVGLWLQQVAWARSKSIGDTGGYYVDGWGVTGGAEYGVGDLGRFGGSIAYLAGKDNDKGTSNGVSSDQYEIAATWRSDWGGLHAFARGSAALIDFKSDRRFTGLDGADAVFRTARGKWHGQLYSGTGGASYRFTFGSFSLRPQVSADYYRLHENHYGESASQQTFALNVGSRTSDELAASGAVALGYKLFDDLANDGGYLRFEIEGGRRQIVSGHLGSTTARFAGGEDFTLLPEGRSSGWTGAFRAKGGSRGFTISGEVTAEQQHGYTALALRAGIQVAF